MKIYVNARKLTWYFTGVYLTIIPWAHVGYEMVNSKKARKAELAITNLISNITNGIIV